MWVYVYVEDLFALQKQISAYIESNPLWVRAKYRLHVFIIMYLDYMLVQL